MGEVWRGRHRAQQVPVAVKVVTAPLGREEAYRAQFVREVEAMARLDHPAIVRLYEHGEIDARLSEASNGRLPEGAPYLVMEWLDGGSLRGRPGLDWPTLRATLLALLDALAHAHAHGMVHRDLKPDNVLLGDRGPVLTDFGLAYNPALSGGALESGSFGTPGYMAPEQIRNDWRAFGPWTDLYALGCLAFELACGFPPHGENHAGSTVGLLVAHLREPVPKLRARLPVPLRFEGWLHKLMTRETGARFQFAADAAVALLAIPEDAPLTGPHPLVIMEPVPQRTDALAETADVFDVMSSPLLAMRATATDMIDESGDLSIETFVSLAGASQSDELSESAGGTLEDELDPGATLPDTDGTLDALLARPQKTLVLPPVFLPVTETSWAAGPGPDGRPPLPSSWRRQREAPPPPLLDAGLNLAPLRNPPTVGREAERDHLWRALRAAAQGSTRVVIIEGPAGHGKT
ncbi:MAG: serine/threonine-protein kinase PknK, partial [Myxococcales bacterium]|nr:serine/threonine-protein kinase PknK [Myxococcales bacterium]